MPQAPGQLRDWDEKGGAETLSQVKAAAQALKAGEEFTPDEQEWLQNLGVNEQEYLKLLTGQ